MLYMLTTDGEDNNTTIIILTKDFIIFLILLNLAHFFNWVPKALDYFKIASEDRILETIKAINEER